jgi:hypothetical protein
MLETQPNRDTASTSPRKPASRPAPSTRSGPASRTPAGSRSSGKTMLRPRLKAGHGGGTTSSPLAALRPLASRSPQPPKPPRPPARCAPSQAALGASQHEDRQNPDPHGRRRRRAPHAVAARRLADRRRRDEGELGGEGGFEPGDLAGEPPALAAQLRLVGASVAAAGGPRGHKPFVSLARHGSCKCGGNPTLDSGDALPVHNRVPQLATPSGGAVSGVRGDLYWLRPARNVLGPLGGSSFISFTPSSKPSVLPVVGLYGPVVG